MPEWKSEALSLRTVIKIPTASIDIELLRCYHIIMAERIQNIHSDVDTQPIGDQLFKIVDSAWQATLADTGDRYERRYDGLGEVGLAFLTSSDRSPRAEGGDNPLLMTSSDNSVPNLAERGGTDRGMLRYRYNHVDSGAEFNPTLLGASADAIPESVLRHGRYPINGAAKRLLLLVRQDASTSFDSKGFITAIDGTIGAAGGIRMPNGRGIIAVSGGNQTHDDLLARHWAWMADCVINNGVKTLTQEEVDDLTVVIGDSMQAAVEHIMNYTRLTFHKRLDELEHPEHGAVIQEASSLLLSQAA
jgi:hypothetical protein